MHGLIYIMDNSPEGVPSSLLTQTKKLLRKFGLRARKGLGQHFLIDADVLHTIVDTAGLTPEDIVIEVGPGLGIMTDELAARAGWVIAIELDTNLATMLQTSLKHDNVVILNENILGLEPGSLFTSRPPAIPAELTSYKVVANLPYYITSPVLRHFLEASVRPESMVVMIQKEVAQTICAGPGKRSLMSIAVQVYGKPEIVTTVPPEAFFPVPAVASAVVRIDVYPEPVVDIGDGEAFFRLVKAGFSAPRKQLHNSLVKGLCLPGENVKRLLDRAEIDPTRRAGTLELEEWARLLRILNDKEMDWLHADTENTR